MLCISVSFYAMGVGGHFQAYGSFYSNTIHYIALGTEAAFEVSLRIII